MRGGETRERLGAASRAAAHVAEAVRAFPAPREYYTKIEKLVRAFWRSAPGPGPTPANPKGPTNRRLSSESPKELRQRTDGSRTNPPNRRCTPGEADDGDWQVASSNAPPAKPDDVDVNPARVRHEKDPVNLEQTALVSSLARAPPEAAATRRGRGRGRPGSTSSPRTAWNPVSTRAKRAPRRTRVRRDRGRRRRGRGHGSATAGKRKAEGDLSGGSVGRRGGRRGARDPRWTPVVRRRCRRSSPERR